MNRPEAAAVVAEVVSRLRSSSHSIGIVTFNAEQQKLIEDMLDQERSADLSLDRFWQKSEVAEPVFVKNLENVQGDEREVIIFSCAAGPDATGRVSVQISSLNSEGGHRRLNVAITRARREMIVFCSMSPEQIDLGRTNARGVVDFKHFLEYAKHGARAIAEAFALTGRDTESPFEDAVKRALEAQQLDCSPAGRRLLFPRRSRHRPPGQARRLSRRRRGRRRAVSSLRHRARPRQAQAGRA